MNRKLAVCAILPFLLSACGGGGDSDDSSSNTPETPMQPAPEQTPVDAVTQASRNTVAQLGLSQIPGNEGNVRVYDVTADIGDSWRLTLDMGTGRYTLKVIYTAYGLTDVSGTFTSVSNGSILDVSGNETALALRLDDRTNTLTGTMTVGETPTRSGRNASVSGTRYAMPADVSVLAGNYNFIVSAHGTGNTWGGTILETSLPGSMMLRSDGTGVACVIAMTTSDGKCSLPGSPAYEGVSLRLALDGATGQWRLTGSAPPALTYPPSGPTPIDMGIVRVQAGDRGPVLVLDLPTGSGLFNASDVSGVTYAVKQQKIGNADIGGGWTCTRKGFSAGSLQVEGNKGTFTNSSGTGILSGFTYTFTHNTYEEDGITLNFDGLSFGVDARDADNEYGLLMLPLTSNTALMMHVNRSANLLTTYCRR